MVEQAVPGGTAIAVSPTCVERTTPAGIEIRYSWKPHRKYEIRKGAKGPASDIPFVKVPSVTTILDLFDKPGLPYWAQDVTIDGVMQLLNTGAIQMVQLPNRDRPVLCTPREGGGWQVAGRDQVLEQLKAFGLDKDHVTSQAGDRGQSVHDAFELWSKEGLKPDPSIFSEQEHGYVEALLKFIEDVPSLEAISWENQVASMEHQYAGRYDFRGRTNLEHEVCFRVTKTRREYYAILPPGFGMIDLKTSKDVYFNQHRQNEGYEIASVECGYEPTVWRAVLNVQKDGKYQLVRSVAEPSDWFAALEFYRSERAMQARKTEHGGAKRGSTR